MARKRVTRATLAQALGKSEATLHRRLRGQSPFNTDELEVIASALGVTVSELLTRAEAAA